VLLQSRTRPDTHRAMPQLDLSSMRVLTFGEFIAGSVAGQLLAGLGAQVVKIESRSHPSALRTAAFNYGPTLATEPSGATITATNASLNRGMKGIALEMSDQAAQGAFKRMVAAADVVIENFGTSVMSNWGCSHGELLAHNPRLIMVSLSGYGRSGPRASHLAYASNISTFTGLASVWATHASLTDYLTGVHVALATIVARNHSLRTGETVLVDAAQIEVMAAAGASLYLGPLVNGEATEPTIGSESSLFTSIFRCAGTDRWACVDILDVRQWNVVCGILHRTDLEIIDGTQAPATATDFEKALVEWAEPRTARTVAKVLTRAGVPAAAVQDTEEMYQDPQIHHRHFPEMRVHRDLGVVTNPGSPHRMSKTPGHFTSPGPRVGEHSRQMLASWADLSSEEIDALIDSGAVFQAPPD